MDTNNATAVVRPSVAWTDCISTEFPRPPATDAVVILPVGSTEQHGPHLPVAVDSMLVEAVALRGAAMAREHMQVHVLPTLWVSLAEHHMGFGGTVTLDFDTLRAFIRCIATSVQRQGFTRMLVLNGHGGNMHALPLIVDQIGTETGLPLATATYWTLAGSAFSSILDGQQNLLHACEAETSMVMHLRPDLVDLRAARTLSAPTTGFFESSGVHRWRPIGHWSCNGVVGKPQLATAEKGARLLGAAAQALADTLVAGSVWSDTPQDATST